MTRKDYEVLFSVFVLFFTAATGRAKVHSHSGEMIVLEAKDLPEVTRVPGNGFFLHATSDARYYLYLEQQHGAQISVLDVTDPSHVTLKLTVQTSATSPFDFIRPVGDSAELVRFQDGNALAILDLKHEGKPEFHIAPNLKGSNVEVTSDQADPIEVKDAEQRIRQTPRDYDVVSTAVSDKPELVATVKAVEYEIVNIETGTTFLLNKDGLTVIRRIQAERDYAARRLAETRN